MAMGAVGTPASTTDSLRPQVHPLMSINTKAERDVIIRRGFLRIGGTSPETRVRLNAGEMARLYLPAGF